MSTKQLVFPIRETGLSHKPFNGWTGMSRELREKADVMMQELREALLPIREEIHRLRNQSEPRVKTYKGEV